MTSFYKHSEVISSFFLCKDSVDANFKMTFIEQIETICEALPYLVRFVIV